MGQINSFNKGELTGLLGNVVFVKGKNGETIVRSRPTKSKRPPSAKKKATWKKFSLINSFLTPIYPFLKESFTDLHGKKTARDAVRSYFLTQAIGQNSNGCELIYTKVLISTGYLCPYHSLNCSKNNLELQLEWKNNSQQAFAEPTDQLSLMLYAPELKEYLFFTDCALRQDESTTLQLPEAFLNTSLHFWLALVILSQVFFQTELV